MAKELKPIAAASVSGPSQDDLLHSSAPIPPDGSKNKSKKKSSVDKPKAEQTASSKAPFWSTFVDASLTTSVIGMDSTLIALDSLHRITSLDAPNETDASTAVRHSLEAVARALQPVLRPAEQSSNRVKRTVFLSRTLEYAFAMGLPVLLQNSSGARQRLDDVLGIFSKSIAVPCIASFISASEALAAAFVSATGHEDIPDDIRYDVLELLRTSFSTIFAREEITTGINAPLEADVSYLLEMMRHSLILEILKEFQQILCHTDKAIHQHRAKEREFDSSNHPGRAKGSAPPPLKRQRDKERLMIAKKLAAKDASWFLCTLLHSLAEYGCKDASFYHGNLDNEVESLYSDDKTLWRLKRAIRDALLHLFDQCQAVQRDPNEGQPLLSSKDAQATSRRTYDSIPPTQCPPHPTAMGDQASAVKRSLEDAETRNQPTIIGTRAGVVDESVYGMLLGVVERISVECL